jgi:hypothetical protein
MVEYMLFFVARMSEILNKIVMLDLFKSTSISLLSFVFSVCYEKTTTCAAVV